MEQYKQIKTEERYNKLLNSGMFWEFHPELTGTWEVDIKLILPDVVKSLPTKDKLNFEDWLKFRKIDKLSDGAYRWEGSLYTEYYVKNIYETYLK